MNIETLKEKNPGLELYSVEDSAFAPYGRILELGDTNGLAKELDGTPIPMEGNSYFASVDSLEGLEITRKIERIVFGGMETQAGACNGQGRKLNALEYHKCSEVNFSTTGLVLLLALPSQLNDGCLDSSVVKGFYLPKNVLVEIYPQVLHFAPCRVEDSGFNCLVVLEKGVNTPLDRVDTKAAGEEKLLWMRGKWLTCHKDSPQAEKGAFTGISGENIELKV